MGNWFLQYRTVVNYTASLTRSYMYTVHISERRTGTHTLKNLFAIQHTTGPDRAVQYIVS